MQYVGLVGGVITTFGGVPQIYKMYTTKRVDDLSWGMLCMWCTGLSMTLVYSMSSNQFAVYVPCVMSLGMTIVMILLKWYYKDFDYKIGTQEN
jgi:MtN3 and saliva related transmembrane protein